MHSKLFYVPLLISVLLFQDSEIKWNIHTLLTWQNFKGQPDLTSSAAAVTAAAISYSYTANKIGTEIINFKVNVTTQFYPEKSWFKKELVNNHILSHEQYHFNIAELFSRKLRRKIAMLQPNSNLKNQIKKTYDSITIELARFQNLYDVETDFSRNYELQKKWELKVARELLALNAYKQ